MNEPHPTQTGRIRTMSIMLPAQVENYVEHEGGMLVRNVPILATGTWTDSAVGTPLDYPTRILERDATNWQSSTFWARHAGGHPRNLVTDALGEIRNQHYDPAVEGGSVVGDVFFHCLTTVSKEGAALALARAKAGRPLMISPEWGGAERYNGQTKKFEAASITFTGAAMVEKGACLKCNLPKAMSADERVKEVEKMEADEIKAIVTEALKGAGAELKTSILAEVDTKIAALSPGKPDAAVAAAMEEKLANAEKKAREMEERLTKLEAEPRPRTVVTETRALSATEGPTAAPARGPRIEGRTIICE